MLFQSATLAAFVAAAAGSNSTGPFALHITGKANSSIDGNYYTPRPPFLFVSLFLFGIDMIL